MGYSDYVIFILEMIGTVAFAASGAMLGINRRMDIFGVNVLGITTAVGGGMIRDLILGINPPVMFQNSVYALTACVAATILFLVIYLRNRLFPGYVALWYDRVMFICDTLGLGIFTVVGSHAAIAAGHGANRFLVVFVGVLTGVGGGMIRDIMAGTMPFIFIKHIYAVASLSGALVYVFAYPHAGKINSMIAGAAVVIGIRMLAAHYRWNLPRI